MSDKTRQTGDLVSDNNIFVDIASDRVGIGTTVTTAKLTVDGDINLTAGIITATAGIITYYGDGSNLTGVAAESADSFLFNAGITSSLSFVATGIGTTALTLPSTAGKQYIVHSILASNIAAGNTEVNFIGSFDFDGGERSYFAYQVPIPTGLSVEMLKQPQVLNPSDEIAIRSTDYDRNGADNIIDVYISYQEKESSDYNGVGKGAAGLAVTTPVTIYTSTSNPSVIQSIRLANTTDTGAKTISVSVNNGVRTTYLVDNLIVPKYGTVEVLDNLKRIETDDIIQVELDEASSIDVQLSAKKITS